MKSSASDINQFATKVKWHTGLLLLVCLSTSSPGDFLSLPSFWVRTSLGSIQTVEKRKSKRPLFFTQIPTSTPSPSHRIRSVKAVVEPFSQRSFRGVGFCQNFGGQTKIFVTLKEMGFCRLICKISAGRKRVVIVWSLMLS